MVEEINLFSKEKTKGYLKNFNNKVVTVINVTDENKSDCLNLITEILQILKVSPSEFNNLFLIKSDAEQVEYLISKYINSESAKYNPDVNLRYSIEGLNYNNALLLISDLSDLVKHANITIGGVSISTQFS
jgi:hypothetical protein